MTQTRIPDHQTWQLEQWAREDAWALDAHLAELEANGELEDEDDE